MTTLFLRTFFHVCFPSLCHLKIFFTMKKVLNSLRSRINTHLRVIVRRRNAYFEDWHNTHNPSWCEIYFSLILYQGSSAKLRPRSTLQVPKGLQWEISKWVRPEIFRQIVHLGLGYAQFHIRTLFKDAHFTTAAAITVSASVSDFELFNRTPTVNASRPTGKLLPAPFRTSISSLVSMHRE